MRAMLIALLLLPAWASAGAGEPATEGPAAASAPLVAAPADGAGPALSVRLKDGQNLHGTLLKYDDYFLSVSNAAGKAFDLPWVEVAEVDGDALGADLALMRGRLSPGGAPVGSVVEARSPGGALAKAFWPGLVLHGYGHRYAGDNDGFISLAGAEIFAVVVGGFGVAELLGPGKAGEHKDTALALSIGGGGIFALSWLWDLAFAPGAARRFNRAQGLAFEPTPTGAKLAYTF